MSKSFEDIFVETLLSRIAERDSSVKVGVKDLNNEAYQMGLEAGIKQERARILRVLDEESDNVPVNWLIFKINKESK